VIIKFTGELIPKQFFLYYKNRLLPNDIIIIIKDNEGLGERLGGGED
jgi:hypothetical protein